MLPAFLATLLFSVSVIAASRSTCMLGANTANFGRVIVAVVFLGLWAHSVGLGFGGGAFAWFFLSGMVGFGLGDIALFHAFPRLGARLSSLLINCLAAPFGALIEWLWLGTSLSGSQVLCGAAILAGVGLALAPEEHSRVHLRRRRAGIVFGALAGLGQAMGAVLSRKAYAVASDAGNSVDGGTAAFQRILGGLLIVALPILWIQLRRRLRGGNEGWHARREDSEQASQVGPREALRQGSRDAQPQDATTSAAWWWVVLNGLAGPTLGVGFYQWALRATPSGLVLAITATTPLVVIPFANWIEGDKPGTRSLAGAVAAVAGVIGLIMVK